MTIGEERLGRTRPAPVLFGVFAALGVLPALVESGGFGLAESNLGLLRAANFTIVGLFVIELALAMRLSRSLGAFLRGMSSELVLMGLLGVSFLFAALFRRDDPHAWLFPAKLYLLLRFVLEVSRLFRALARRRINYARTFVLSFVLVIVVGALVLYLLPGTKAEGKDLSLLDAVFTATSATCVTGLVTVDTGTHFSRFGQTVILVLFQLGGIGLMTYAAFFSIVLGKGMGLRASYDVGGALGIDVMGRVIRLVMAVLLITLVVEAVAATILYGRWQGDMSSSDRLFFSVFHSVSAFCNAGFGLRGSSLEEYVADPVVNATVMAEIVVGGLGFLVLLDILGRVVPRTWRIRKLRSKELPGKRLSVQTKIVLVSSLVLIVGGASLLLLFESDNPETLAPLGTGEQVGGALFTSITARTAGFNTISVDSLRDTSKFLLVAMMLIGASPGSTGGGIKTVTAVVLLLTVITMYRSRDRVEVFGRTVPGSTVRRAIVIGVSAFAFVTVGTLVVACAEGERLPFLSVLFEVASAFGTVGLSTGITGELTAVSKITLCVLMLVGRIGPLSLVVALGQARPTRRFEYPEEQVMIG